MLTIQFLSKLIIQFIPYLIIIFITLATITKLTNNKSWLRQKFDKIIEG